MIIRRGYRFRSQPPPAPVDVLTDRTPHTSLYTLVTSDYRVTLNDVVILASGNLTITLPIDVTRLGQKVVIKNIGTGQVRVQNV